MNHTPTPSLSPLPGQQSPGARLAAAAEADQVEGTPTLRVHPFALFLASSLRACREEMKASDDEMVMQKRMNDIRSASTLYSEFLMVSEADQVKGIPVDPFSAFLSSEIKRFSTYLDAFGVDYFDRLAFKAYLEDYRRASVVYARFLSTQPGGVFSDSGVLDK